MSILRASAFIAAIPFLLIGLPLMSFAYEVKFDWRGSLSEACRKLG